MSEAAPTAKKKQKKDSPPEPRIIDAHEAARILGRDYYTVRRWALSGALPLVRFPSVESTKGRRSTSARPIRRLLFDVRDVEAFITRCKQAS